MNKLLLILLLFPVLIFANLEERGLTCRELSQPASPTSARAVAYTGSEYEINRHRAEISREGWELADSVNINTFLAAGDHISVEYSGQMHQLIFTGYPFGLCGAAEDAIEKSPLWIRAELESTLRSLNEEKQMFWSEVLNSVHDPIIDEVAFCIATASKAYLESEWAYPELYIQNAEMIYEYDQELSYVEVIDYGNSVTDEDYYSTTRYRKKAADGSVYEVEVPREIYYWHIVHPKITDEIPAFIDPSVIESNSTHNNNIVAPDEGYFWRDFLYNYSDEGYPSLRNYLLQCEYANDFTTGYDSAIGACTQWLAQSLQFTSNIERPHQPVRIYRKHIGRCGEHADMRVAIGRIALVPVTSIVCFTVDHTWNEFWDEEWVHWDGGDINNFYMYEQGWGSNFGSVIDVRSDGLMTSVTEKYAPGYAVLRVHALDLMGEPIDGARVLIGLRLNNQVTGDMVGWTSNAGFYEFTIGDGHEYWVAMSSSVGNVEYQMVTENSGGGEIYEVQLQTANALPQLEFAEIDIPADDGEDYRLVVEFEADDQIVYGNIVMDDTSEDTWFYERRVQGAINFFMCDLVQYFSYIAGLEFEAFNCITESDFGFYGFDMPCPDMGSWYAVLDNKNNAVNPQWVKGSVMLYRWEGLGGAATLCGIVSDAADDEPISGAMVRAGAFECTTSENGEYSLQVYPGNYTVVIDHPLYERIRYENINLVAEEEYMLNCDLSDEPIKPLHLIVSGDDNTNAIISWESPASLMNRSLLGYRVYRLDDAHEFQPENWLQITTGILTETSLIDEEWLQLPAGVYRYAVSAEYSESSSDFAVSYAVPLYMTAAVNLELSTNSGDSAAGAEIRLENTEGVNSPYNYSFIYPAEGSLIMPSIWKGEYELRVLLTHFEVWETILTVEDNLEIDFELIELLPGPHFAGVYNYYASWDAVPQNREFLEYRLYLDNEEPELAVVYQPGYDLSISQVDAGEHILQIVAFYSSGVSLPAEISFVNGSSLECELLAHFPFDEDLIDIVSGWYGESEAINLVTTPFGNGAEFNGAEFITVAANPALTESALHYTILLWINAADMNTGWRGVAGRPGRNQCLWINADNDYLHHRFHTAGGGSNDGAPNTPNGSFHWLEWNQVAIVNDGYAAKTYINGELLAEKVLSSPLIADSTAMYIGKSPDSPTAEGYLYGLVDDVRIWNRGLSDLELTQLYIDEVAPLGSGIISALIIDAGSGTALAGVRMEAGIYVSESGEDGCLQIEVPARTYDLRFILDDYLMQREDDFTVIAGENNELIFEFELTDDDKDEIIITPRLSVIAYPNPFSSNKNRNPGTNLMIKLNAEIPHDALLNIYNIKGQRILTEEFMLLPGENNYHWNGRNKQNFPCTTGVYIYQVIFSAEEKTGKLLMLK